ncbi:hypothetical protein IWZ00DRAFT_492661 [Phyllosticta capitalensis]|uniref:Uncharacterized protein n=1 Tax=Phyllosticta capitalensis TaxID=121624 RepID=A0ABR1YIG4_9PEZI
MKSLLFIFFMASILSLAAADCSGIVGFLKQTLTGDKVRQTNPLFLPFHAQLLQQRPKTDIILNLQPQNKALPKNKRVLPTQCEIWNAVQGCKSGLGKNCGSVNCNLYDGSCGFSGTKLADAYTENDQGDSVFFDPYCNYGPSPCKNG